MGILMYTVPCEVSTSANARHVVSADSTMSWLNERVDTTMRFLHLPVGKVVAKTGSSLMRLLPTTAPPADGGNPSGRFESLASCRVAWKTTRSLTHTPSIKATAPLPFGCVECAVYSFSSVIGFIRSVKDHLILLILAAYSGPLCFCLLDLFAPLLQALVFLLNCVLFPLFLITSRLFFRSPLSV